MQQGTTILEDILKGIEIEGSVVMIKYLRDLIIKVQSRESLDLIDEFQYFGAPRYDHVVKELFAIFLMINLENDLKMRLENNEMINSLQIMEYL